MDDVLSVYKYVKNRVNLAPKLVILCGYSYGSVATCSVYKEIPECIGMYFRLRSCPPVLELVLNLRYWLGIISISFPAGVLWYLTLGNSNKVMDALSSSSKMKKLFLIGSKDQFTGTSKFTDFTSKLPEPKEVKVVQGVDHFWGGEEEAVVEIIAMWLAHAKVIPERAKGTPLPPIETLRSLRPGLNGGSSLTSPSTSTSSSSTYVTPASSISHMPSTPSPITTSAKEIPTAISTSPRRPVPPPPMSPTKQSSTGTTSLKAKGNSMSLDHLGSSSTVATPVTVSLDAFGSTGDLLENSTGITAPTPSPPKRLQGPRNPPPKSNETLRNKE
jgi:dienelactone hydrolase